MKWFLNILFLILGLEIGAQTTAISVIEVSEYSGLEEIDLIMEARPEVVDYQFVDVNYSALLEDASIQVSFFDVDMIINRDFLEKRTFNDFSWFGGDNEQLLSVVFTVSNNEIIGTITSPNLSYSIESINGVNVLMKVDQSMFPQEDCMDFIADNQMGIENDDEEDEDPEPSGMDVSFYGCKLRVLVMYTPKADAKCSIGMSELAQFAVDQLNYSLIASNTGQEAELVYVGEVQYTESSSMKEDLRRFRDKNDNIMDNVHSVRDEYGADVCILLLYNGNHQEKFCGKAAAARSSRDQAFAVVDYRCVTTAKSFAHEIGHLYGADHANLDPHDLDLHNDYPYAHGYKDPGGSWRTIMAYNCPNGHCNRLGYFSDPNSNQNGTPKGDANSFNVRMIRENGARMMYLRRSGHYRCILNSDVNVDLVKSLYSSGFIETINNVVIQSGRDYRFVAEESVLLQVGFEVDGEAIFEATVSSCGEEGSGRFDYGALSDVYAKNSFESNHDNLVIDFELFPNPVDDKLKIPDEFLIQEGGCSVSIFSISGIEVISEFNVNSDGLVPVSELSNGIYILQLSSEKFGVKVSKFVKK